MDDRAFPRSYFMMCPSLSRAAASSQSCFFCPLKANTQESLSPHPPVLDGHDVVEDGIDRGGEVVEAASDVEQLLVDLQKGSARMIA